MIQGTPDFEEWWRIASEEREEARREVARLKLELVSARRDADTRQIIANDRLAHNEHLEAKIEHLGRMREDDVDLIRRTHDALDEFTPRPPFHLNMPHRLTYIKAEMERLRLLVASAASAIAASGSHEQAQYYRRQAGLPD